MLSMESICLVNINGRKNEQVAEYTFLFVTKGTFA